MTSEKRQIDANALKDNFSFLRKMWSETEIISVIDNAPTVDAVEVVRCKNCKHQNEDGDCNIHDSWFKRKPDSFCCYGEKRDGG